MPISTYLSKFVFLFASVILALSACQTTTPRPTGKFEISAESAASMTLWFDDEQPLLFAVTEDGRYSYQTNCPAGGLCLDETINALNTCERFYGSKCLIVGELGSLLDGLEVVAPKVTERTFISTLTFPGSDGNSLAFRGGYLTLSADGSVRDTFSIGSNQCDLEGNDKSQSWKITCKDGNVIAGTLKQTKPGFYRGIGRDSKDRPYTVFLVKPSFLEKYGVKFAGGA